MHIANGIFNSSFAIIADMGSDMSASSLTFNGGGSDGTGRSSSSSRRLVNFKNLQDFEDKHDLALRLGLSLQVSHHQENPSPISKSCNSVSVSAPFLPLLPAMNPEPPSLCNVLASPYQLGFSWFPYAKVVDPSINIVSPNSPGELDWTTPISLSEGSISNNYRNNNIYNRQEDHENAQDYLIKRPRNNRFQPQRPGTAIWFMLQLANDQDPNKRSLPQMPKTYIRVKDGSMTINTVKKYLAKKLGLKNYSEIEISCKGQRMSPLVTLQHVRDTLWFAGGSSHVGITDNNREAAMPLPSKPSCHVMILHYSTPQ